MRKVRFDPTFAAWQVQARRLLRGGVEPRAVHWEEIGRDDALGLFEEDDLPETAGSFSVPRKFVSLAETVACHSDPARWAMLYRVLWRLTHGEPKLMEISVDPDLHRLLMMEKSVRRDIHKMRAFVRFRTMERDGDMWHVAWFEPEHHIVERNAPFFVERFAGMKWAILTPDSCVAWDGAALAFSPGADRSAAPADDPLETLWLTYYGSIFNPARIKTHAMVAEMPKKYWKNLPEAATIPRLLSEAPGRVAQMLEHSAMKSIPRAAEVPETESLRTLEKAVAKCTACPLYRNATQVVFGRGAREAKLMFVGEQPGDQEDRAGEPFVGPAGQLLNRALEEAGIDRNLCYVTNAVKHFKWEARGKHRIHKSPSASEVAACHPWLEAEIDIVRPEVLICLGGTAAQAVVGPKARVLRDRGKLIVSPYCDRTMITIHPSALLRAPDEAARKEGYDLMVRELRIAAGWLEN
jgi:probable DNA metabolism protein